MIPCLLFGYYYPRQPAALATPAASSCGPCLHVGAKWENDVLMVNRQAKPLWQDAVPPRDTVLPVPAGVPQRGKGRTVSLGGRFSTMLRSSRGVAKEGGQLLPRRHPPQALSGSIVEKHLDPLEFLLADLSEGRLLG